MSLWVSTSDAVDLLRDSALLGAAVASSSVILNAVDAQDAKPTGTQEPEAPATEDLMREHGVIRSALLVYAETAP